MSTPLQQFPYSLIRSSRARYMRITVRHTGEVKVVVPKYAPPEKVRTFVESREQWIRSKRDHFLRNPVSEISVLLSRRSLVEYRGLKGEALQILSDRLIHFNRHYKCTYTKVSIRNQTSRWGSCTQRGAISFNYKLILLPDELRDYVVVHELCHLKQLNHSRAFWDLVAETVPNHRELRRRLKGIE